MHKQCSFEGCGRAKAARGYCNTHYKQLSRRGELTTINSRKGVGNITKDGYRRIKINGVVKYEHRLVLGASLGRELRPEENVHHLNGDRLDNSPGNLELWSKSQPAGQRVRDKVEWAIELLKLYSPEALHDRQR